MTMIPQDRDRFECLKLAVTLLIPRSNAAASSQLVVLAAMSAADQFYKYVTEPEKNDKPA